MTDRLDIIREIARLEGASLHDLRTEWRGHYRSEPPRHVRQDFLIRGITYRLQEQVHGGLRQATKRVLRTLAKEGSVGRDANATAPILKPGVRLVRSWHGVVHEVLVQRDGFDYRGGQYRSLSQIATMITGTRWSGPRFFGVGRMAGKSGLVPSARKEARHAPA
jgi:Protein of unknown function (DUF2924)